MDGERLLTYAAAAQAMGISEKAFRRRVARGSILAGFLFDRQRGNGMKPERFVLWSEDWERWVKTQRVERTPEQIASEEGRSERARRAYHNRRPKRAA